METKLSSLGNFISTYLEKELRIRLLQNTKFNENFLYLAQIQNYLYKEKITYKDFMNQNSLSFDLNGNNIDSMYCHRVFSDYSLKPFNFLFQTNKDLTGNNFLNIITNREEC